MKSAIDKTLSSEEKKVLLSLANSHGWEIMKKLAKEMTVIWSYQALTPDTIDDDAIKVMYEYRGMRRGVTELFNEVTRWTAMQNQKDLPDEKK
jgi:hypothetical protein